jgi:hypothetical protein
MSEVKTVPAEAVMATGSTLLERLIDVPLKTLTAGENELFDKTDMQLAAGYGAVGGAALQGMRANKRIKEAAQTGVARPFKYALI